LTDATGAALYIVDAARITAISANRDATIHQSFAGQPLESKCNLGIFGFQTLCYRRANNNKLTEKSAA